ncbi:MAG: zinc-binding alcohol dehydrogenase family protein [Pseudomonadota bacterium]
MNIQTITKTSKALWLTETSPDLDNLKINVEEMQIPSPGPGQVLIEIRAAGVNPSDVKASLGHMPHAVWPRTPGRDFAGLVAEGPDHMLGLEVWGGGGELGITQNGSHARFMVLPQAAVRAKPANLSFEEAGSIGVPFITAFEGLQEVGFVQPWQTVLVCGVNGKVGQATTQLASLMGATVIGVGYRPGRYIGHAATEIPYLDMSAIDVPEAVKELTGGKGADIVMNTVGSPFFEVANKSMAKNAKQIFISTFDRAVDFDIFAFFRGRHTYVGIDTLARDSVYGAKVFDALKPRFESGHLQPFPINQASVYRLEDAANAFASVLRSTPDRVLLKP